MARASVSGFTFLRHGVKLGFPFEASIRSILPLVDEFVIALGRGEDDTEARIAALAAAEPKIRILPTIWNERMAEKGFVYAQQKMIAQYACTGDWAFYLEGDEVLHEAELPAIRAAIDRHHGNPAVEALVFDYLHFYGSPAWLAVSPAWYRREGRLIRNTIRSYAPDGQFWVVMDKHRRPGQQVLVAPAAEDELLDRSAGAAPLRGHAPGLRARLAARPRRTGVHARPAARADPARAQAPPRDAAGALVRAGPEPQALPAGGLTRRPRSAGPAITA